MRGTCFRPYPIRHGLLEDLTDDPFAAKVYAWDQSDLDLPDEGTSYGFVAKGEAELTNASGSFRLVPGMYFSQPGKATISGGSGIVISRTDYEGIFQLGGPVEERGRLRYIDGCTDTLLLAPARWGDPCLNLLHIPPHTEQTQHTHPSFRSGIIVSGQGRCVTPEGTFPLEPGQVFVIPAEGLHSFFTEEQALRVIAFHPDSDFGPTDEAHPMINRTIIPKASL